MNNPFRKRPFKEVKNPCLQDARLNVADIRSAEARQKLFKPKPLHHTEDNTRRYKGIRETIQKAPFDSTVELSKDDGDFLAYWDYNERRFNGWPEYGISHPAFAWGRKIEVLPDPKERPMPFYI